MHKPSSIDDRAGHPTGNAGRLTAALAVLSLVTWVGAVGAAAQVQPQPWPQRGDTDLEMENIEEAIPINAGVQTPFVFGNTEFATVVPLGKFTYTEFNSWDIPNGKPKTSALSDTGLATGHRYRRDKFLLTDCPGPVLLDCSTGGTMTGKTYGALFFRVGITPNAFVQLDTLNYRARWRLTYPSPGSFAPGDTISIGVDVTLDSAAALVASGQLESATLTLHPFFDPFLAELTMRTCVLGECRSRVRRVTGPLHGDTLVVSRVFDGKSLAARGLSGMVRLPRLNLTNSRVEDGRRIFLSGYDAYATLDWDLNQFLCRGCLSGTVKVLRSTLEYQLLDWDLHTHLKTFSEFVVEPRVRVKLDLGAAELDYVVQDPDGHVVDSGTDSMITFRLGHSVGLVVPSGAPGTVPAALTMTPSIVIRLNELGYNFMHITGPLRRNVKALRTKYTIPPATAGPFSFAGGSFQLGPAHDNQFVSDSVIAKFGGTYVKKDSLDEVVPLFERRDTLGVIELAPELPNTSTTFGTGLPSVPLPAPQASEDAAGATTSAGARESLLQPITVRNVGNVHLADLGVDYELRATTPVEVVADGSSIVARRFLEILGPVEVDVPVELERGREYQLSITVRATTPIGSAVVNGETLTIGMFGLHFGTPETTDGLELVPVTIRSSPELDVRRIDLASILVEGLAAVDWSWHGTAGLESLVLRFPAADLLQAARDRLNASPSMFASADVVRHLVAAAQSLSQEQVDVLDRLGNDNGRLDVGDVRAYLLASGELSGTGGAAVPPATPPTTVPATLLLTGVMDGDQRAYGVGVMLLNEEGS